jgi:hypothetical protein
MISDVDASLSTNFRYRIGTFVKEGLLHKTLSLGCQDACHIAQVIDQTVKVVVVCDGCSSNELGFTHNQVGAVLGAYCFGNFLANNLLISTKEIDRLKFEKTLKSAAKQTRHFFGKMLTGLGLQFGSDAWDKFVIDKLLFTILGFAIVGDQYWVFGLGDGCYGINGDIKVIDTPTTPYFGESLLTKNELTTYVIDVHKSGKTESMQHLWVASDGLNDLLSLPQGIKDFSNFLDDEFTCARNNKGEDMTIQAFRRRVLQNHSRKFSDDVAFAIVKP